MFKKLIFIAATAIFFTQSVVYSEESIKPVDSPAAGAADISEIEKAIALEVEKLIAALEAKGYSKDQILNMLNTEDLTWQEVANNCLHKALIVALVALAVWTIKEGSLAYARYKDAERRDEDLRLNREMWERRFIRYRHDFNDDFPGQLFQGR